MAARPGPERPTQTPSGLEPIWERDSLDWKDLQAPEIIKRVTGKVQPGSIVLFHNAALHTPEALPAIIETLLRDGYTFVPISQIVIQGPYTIDHTGRQLPAPCPAPDSTETIFGLPGNLA